MPRVARAIAPLFVRTTKGRLDLPPVTRASLQVPLADLHAQIYDALRNQYAGELLVGRRDRVDFIRLGKVVMSSGGCDHPSCSRLDPSRAATRRSSDIPRWRSRRLRLCPACCAIQQARRRASSSNWPSCFTPTSITTRPLIDFSATSRSASFRQPALIHGAVPPFSSDPDVVTRDREIARFRKDPDCLVLLANPAAMSEGISLHKQCHDAIVRSTFNAGQLLQSVDRIHRLGLDDDEETRITFLISTGTIDEKTRGSVKAERLSQMFQRPRTGVRGAPERG